MSQKIITLTHYDASLIGKYDDEDYNVLCILDTSHGIAFSVSLPDLESNNDRAFAFKNLPFGSAGAVVTVSAINGQLIDGVDVSHTVTAGKFATVLTGLNTWILDA